MGGGRRKMSSAEERRRCSYQGLERIRLGLSLGFRGVWGIRSGCRHSCSVVSQIQNQYQRVRAISEEEHDGSLMGKAGHRLQQGRATNLYLAHQHLVAQELIP